MNTPPNAKGSAGDGENTADNGVLDAAHNAIADTHNGASQVLTVGVASKFASLALAHVTREYPNKLDHVLLEASDATTPRALHPIFYGSFDWHSCVHGYWLLARLMGQFPDLPERTRIVQLFTGNITAANVVIETAYAAHPSRGGFERPYGWAWLLYLVAELKSQHGEHAANWAELLAPLASRFAQRWCDFLPKATYPTRSGAHFNSAFAVLLSLRYARVVQDTRLERVLGDAALQWFGNDTNAECWEPSGDDFLSPTLMEAVCMQSVLAPDAFAKWMDAFLPRVAEHQPATLFMPSVVSDRTDGKIAHLDGLNLSRAWCWRTLASTWPASDARRRNALHSADVHLDASLPHVAGDYAGEHWLATFAVLALHPPPHSAQ